MSQRFLGGENVNLVINNIISGLTKLGVNPDVKNLQMKIPDFMYKVGSQYQNSSLEDLNNLVIQKVLEKYVQGQAYPTQQPRGKRSVDVADKYEQALAERNYQTREQNQPPPKPDFTQPIGPGGLSGINLSQLGIDPQQNLSSSNYQFQTNQSSRYNPDDEFDLNQRPYNQNRNNNQDNNQNNNQQNNDQNNQQIANPNNQLSRKLHNGGQPIWLSLNKENLVDSTDNAYTFSWNQKKLFPEFKQQLVISLKYVTIPKNLPYLLIKYSCPSHLPHQELNQLYSASGKKYSAKLIPCHTAGENTTYQALGEHFIIYEELPSSITFEIIPPQERSDQDPQLGLQKISVAKVSKHNSQIQITTKFPHNLASHDQLILEFPKQSASYKVSNLQILDQYQILVDSPFVGYFSSDFSLLRSNWNLDVTLLCNLN